MPQTGKRKVGNNCRRMRGQTGVKGEREGQRMKIRHGGDDRGDGVKSQETRIGFSNALH
jgi:hypothetical protein